MRPSTSSRREEAKGNGGVDYHRCAVGAMRGARGVGGNHLGKGEDMTQQDEDHIPVIIYEGREWIGPAEKTGREADRRAGNVIAEMHTMCCAILRECGFKPTTRGGTH